MTANEPMNLPRMISRFLLSCFPLFLCASAMPQTFSGPPRIPQKDSRFEVKLKPIESGGKVTWTVAENGSQEIVKDEYVILQGGVKLEYQDVTIQADHLVYYFKTKEMTAEGHVVIDQGPQRLAADKAVYNLDSQLGMFENARGSAEPSLYFTGERIEKTGPKSYLLTNGIFTSCDIDHPDWSFRVGSASITLDDYAHLRNVSFRAGSVPLFYTPWLVWPTKSDRSRGFLVPKPGHNNRYGTYLKNEYFVPLGKAADVSVRGDVFSTGMFATGLEARYVPTEKIKGNLNVYAVHDPGLDLSGDPPRDAQWEWRYDYQHTQDGLPGGFRGVVDVKDFSDLDFFQRLENDFDLHTTSTIYSSAYLTKNRSNYSLNIRTDRREHLLGTIVNPDGSTSPNSRLFEQLPAVEFRIYPNKVGPAPLYFSLESSASHLRTINQLGAQAAEITADYYRSDLKPTLTMQLKTPAWLSIKPQLSLRETYYSASLCDPARAEPCPPATSSGSRIVDESLNRFFAQGEVELVGPSLSKIYNLEFGGFNKFKHVIEPRVRYLYTTDVDNQNRVIRFDTIDSPSLPLVRNSMEYSLTQRVIGKEAKEGASARDIMSFSIRQSVSLSEPFNPSSSATTNKFSPLAVSARVNPYQRITVDGTLTYGNVSHQLDRASLSANLIGQKAYLNLTWFSTYTGPQTGSDSASQIRFSTGGPLFRDRIRGDAQVNYDAGKGIFLEQRYLLGFSASCYDIALQYRDFLQFQGLTNRPNRDYQISVSLKNVGTFVDFRGSLNNFF